MRTWILPLTASLLCGWVLLSSFRLLKAAKRASLRKIQKVQLPADPEGEATGAPRRQSAQAEVPAPPVPQMFVLRQVQNEIRGKDNGEIAGEIRNEIESGGLDAKLARL